MINGDQDVLDGKETTAHPCAKAIQRFGLLARDLRTTQRISQAALAQAARISPSTVRGWEAGRSEPSMPEFSRWSQALGLTHREIAAVRATLHAPRAWADRPGIGFGPYLRERRLSAEITLSRAAADVKLPLATLGHYESGRVEVPTAALKAIIDRLGLSDMESTVISGGTGWFLEWCDALVADPKVARQRAEATAFAHTSAEMYDQGPGFIRMRTGLLRARLCGEAWAEVERFVTVHHALWLAIHERRAEAAAALASLDDDREPVAMIARRYLGRTHADDLQEKANSTQDLALASWLRAEAALDLCERRRGADAKMMVQRTLNDVANLENPDERWMRLRDAVRVALRLRDWSSAELRLTEMTQIKPQRHQAEEWFSTQWRTLQARLATREATARPA